MNTFISAVLVGLVGVFCMWDSRLLGRLNFEQPLVGATLVGLLLGDVPTGLAVGAAVELVSMGLVQVGAAVPPDMVLGGMIATLIGATTPLQFADGTVVIQDILDGMMPQMISLGLTGLMYWLIKKNVNTGWLLVIAIVGGIALSAAGILA